MAKAKELASQCTQTAKDRKKSVNSFAFTSLVISADRNFADRQMINRKITADKHYITTNRRAAANRVDGPTELPR